MIIDTADLKHVIEIYQDESKLFRCTVKAPIQNDEDLVALLEDIVQSIKSNAVEDVELF